MDDATRPWRLHFRLANMAEYALSFSNSHLTDTGSYKLMELPPDLFKLVEADSNAASTR